MWQTSAWPGAAFAIGSAALFGASTPLAKLLLGGGVDPQLLAGLFYLGSGLGLSVVQWIRTRHSPSSSEAPLRRRDLPRLAGAVLLGGALAPTLLLLGLARTPASASALLLNLEGVATMVIAWVVFREHVDRQLLLGSLAITLGAAVLAWNGGSFSASRGALLIVGACMAWGVDNNLTRTLSAADPVQIAWIKGLVAGGVNVALALGLGAHLPASGTIIGAAIIGFFGYGVSLVMFVRALRHLGAARTSAYFSTAPFVGALLSLGLFSEPPTYRLVLAGGLMALGVYLHLRETHEHEHQHPALEHEHLHTHDAHHQHDHACDESPTEPHSHLHRHLPLAHKHPHYPDLHHHHEH